MTTLAEPEWDDRTRDLALAFDDWDECPVCGGPAELCQDPERQFDWRVPEPTRCHRTTALREAQDKVTEATNPHTNALIWGTTLREGDN
mgnify:CR=1 FL=1